MVNPREILVLIDGQNKTLQISHCAQMMDDRRVEVIFKNNPRKKFRYGLDRITSIKNPVVYDLRFCKVIQNDRQLSDVVYVAHFDDVYKQYYYIEFATGRCEYYSGDDIEVIKSCFEHKSVKRVFDYMRMVATINPLKQEDDDTSLLQKQYDKVKFIATDTAASVYLNPDENRLKRYNSPTLIFPFGTNASQLKAVKTAFENQISVIQGPPGTGKTQTILNIVANVVLQGKTVLVVSNNNSAISNIEEKMQQYQLDFIMALLGSRSNKEKFIDAQALKTIPEDIISWHSPQKSQSKYLKQVDDLSQTLVKIFVKQERLAIAKQELAALKIEQHHFSNVISVSQDFSFKRKLSSDKLMQLWHEMEKIQNGSESKHFFTKLINPIYNYWATFKLKWLFNKLDDNLTIDDVECLIPFVQAAYYQAKQEELLVEIATLEKYLIKYNAGNLLKKLQDDSMCCLRHYLHNRYQNHNRSTFTIKTLGKRTVAEYPVILSTTFSAYSNFGEDVVFDYVIMDEASQISSETAVLALACARNAVIVGDSMQLPNVITEDDRLKLRTLALKSNIKDCYDCEKHSFLESICNVFPNVSQTLLREHYRCHPQIINFCNQKYYGGKLVVMTADSEGDNVVSAIRTVKGNHSRGHLNMREVEVIKKEVLPTLSIPAEEIGIIAPYKKQVDVLRKEVDEKIDVATIHKFQGREKDAIIFSVVDDVVTAFSDNANLFNVALSRAKKKFCLVVSSNEQPTGSNVAEFLDYLAYNNCSITQSNIHSVFDMLYSQYTAERLQFLRKHKNISEYDSENLMYAMLDEILQKNFKFSHMGVICHFPMNRLIRNTSLLTETDKIYAMNPRTHVDFLVYNHVSKKPVLAIEVDGYSFHKSGTKQSYRDSIKDEILKKYAIPLLRLSTIGSGEKQKIVEKLNSL